MQTTLLGLGIAIILAIVAALVAPLVIDWNHYRSAFETEASRLTGLTVRVNGKIDARILPTPLITLRNVEAGAPGREPQLRAGSIQLEVGLGPLLRGELQASQVHLVAPQLDIGLDRSGAIDWPAPAASFRPQALSVSHFNVVDGRMVLTDARSGSRLTVQNLSFDGDIQSFLGPFNGDGVFAVGNDSYDYHLSGGREGDDSGLKIRLGVDPSDRPLTTEIDGTLTTEQGVPQFDGTLALVQPVGAALASGQRVLSEPWHLSGKLQATPAAAALHDIAFQYGPDESSLDFTGRADVTLGAQPHLNATIAAMQLDVDRAVADPDVTHRPPLLLIKNFLETFVASAKLPLPADIGVGVDTVTVGGTAIQSLHGTVRFNDGGWSLNGFQFRAPGLTQVDVSGQLADTAQGLAFKGPGTIDSADVDGLLSWLRGLGNAPSGQDKTLNAHGEITISGDRVAVDGLNASLGNETIDGQLAYTWAAGDHPAGLDANLRAATLDLDALVPFEKAAADNGFALPRRGSLVLDIGKATSVGVDARQVDARLKFDGGALQIDRLAIGELGGATLTVSGRIEELSSRPRGQITLDLDAQALAGLTNVVGKFAPRSADVLRRYADRLAPAKLHANLTVESAAVGGSTAKFVLGGELGLLRVSLNGEGTGEPSHLGASKVRIESRVDADDGTVPAALFGLDHVVGLDQLPASVTLSASGPLDGELHVDGQVTASGLSSAVHGALRLQGEGPPSGTLQVLASAGDLRPLAQMMTGQPGDAVPVSGRAALSFFGKDLTLSDLAVTVGKSALRGRLNLDLASPIAVNGDIEADDADAPSVAALLLGLPRVGSSGRDLWSSAALGSGGFAAVNGALTFKLNRAAFTSALVARELTGVLQFHPSEIVLDKLDGDLAGGRVTGDVALRRNADMIDAHARIALDGADTAAILGADKTAVDGKLTLNLKCDSVGGSPIDLIRALNGSGTIALADAHIAGLDGAAFDVAMRTADQSATIEAPKIQAAVSAALANGVVAVPKADNALTLAGGKLSIVNATLKADDGSDLLLNGTLDLGNDTIDARATLTGHPGANALIRMPPELAVALKGPLAAPQRRLDTVALTSWLTLRAAELQTRRLESLQANRRADVLGPAIRPAPPFIRSPPSGMALEFPAVASLAPPPGSRGFDRLHVEPTTVKPIAARPAVNDAAAGATVEQKPRPSPQAVAAPPPSAPTLRSLLQRLFRTQN